MRRNTMATPKIKIHKHNHNHKYDTRSKRHCCLCPSIKGPIAAKENDIQNRERRQITCSKRLVGRKSVRNKRVVAFELPDELIDTILLRVPAKFLHENMRFVSRVWRQTITSPSFITNHLQISSGHTHGLLIDHPEQPNVALYIKPPTSGYTNAEFQLTELPKPPFQSRIRGSYHGLVLLQEEVNMGQFHVVNLVTKSIVSLPCFHLLRLFANLSKKSGALNLVGVAFSYASSMNRYKVVIGIHPLGKHPFQRPKQPTVWVCTVGVDRNWRKLELQGIDEIRGTCSRIPLHTPRSVGGFIYWSSRSFPNGCALDVDIETFYRFTMLPTPNTIPQTINDPDYWIICLQTGLGLVISYKFELVGHYVLWELYELSDLKSSKWTKIVEIDVSVIRSQIEKYFQPRDFWSLTPLVYTNDGKLWFLSCYSSVDIFYYHPREENVMPVPVNGKAIPAYHHVNTLIPLTNC